MSGGDGDSALPAPLAPVSVNADVRSVVANSRSFGLMPAIANIEKAAGVDSVILKSIGMGTDAGTLFFDCISASEKTAWVRMYLVAIKTVDPGGWDVLTEHCEDDPAEAVFMGRLLRNLLIKLDEQEKESAVVRPKVTVVNANDDDNAYMVAEFTGTELDEAQKLVRIMFGRRFNSGYVPKIAVLKRMCYSVKMDTALPSIERIPLKSLRVLPGDTPIILFKRWLVGHMVCSVGASVPVGVVSNGCGDLPMYGEQWMSWFDCVDLLEAMELCFVGMPLASQTSLIESTVTIMSALTSTGRPRLSASAAISGAVHDVLRMSGSARLSMLAPEPPQPIPPGEQPPNLGPNGLVKMKGGNPNGELCLDFARGKCPRNKCSFSHKRKTVAVAPGDGPEEAAEA